MKGCFCLKHTFSITQYNMETVVIESLFVEDRSGALFDKMSYKKTWGHCVT